jgi:hypothetical protein
MKLRRKALSFSPTVDKAIIDVFADWSLRIVTIRVIDDGLLYYSFLLLIARVATNPAAAAVVGAVEKAAIVVHGFFFCVRFVCVVEIRVK